MKKPTKKNDKQLWVAISEALSNANYVFVSHAKERLQDRKVTDLEVLDILDGKERCKRKRNKQKDSYDERYSDWKYCVEGLSVDREKIRIIISFNEDMMLVITVMRLREGGNIDE